MFLRMWSGPRLFHSLCSRENANQNPEVPVFMDQKFEIRRRINPLDDNAAGGKPSPLVPLLSRIHGRAVRSSGRLL